MRRLMAIGCVFLVSFGCASGQDLETTASLEPTEPGATTPAASPGGLTYTDHGTETFTSEAFEVQLELDDFSFEPTFIKAPGGGTATMKLRNEGSVPHTFTSSELGFDEEVAPGASKDVEVKLGTATRYEFSCRFHAGRGMRGAFQPH